MVPSKEAMVTTTPRFWLPPPRFMPYPGAVLMQEMEVLEDQEEEPHRDEPKRTEGLRFEAPKFTPAKVIEAAPEVGLFALFGICDVIGESYVKKAFTVPVALEIVMATAMVPPAPLAAAQYRLV